MIEDYFNSNGVVGVTPPANSNNTYFVGFALCAAIILWLKRRNQDEDDSMFIKLNNKNSWNDFIRDPLNRRRRDNDDNDFDEII